MKKNYRYRQLTCRNNGDKRSEFITGAVLADTIRGYMDTMKIENGLSGLGYTKDDVPALVRGTLPQQRLTKLAPRPQTEEDLTHLFLDSMTVY